MNDRAIAGEFVTKTFDYGGSRQVTHRDTCPVEAGGQVRPVFGSWKTRITPQGTCTLMPSSRHDCRLEPRAASITVLQTVIYFIGAYAGPDSCDPA
jgi:hypothetical protein